MQALKVQYFLNEKKVIGKNQIEKNTQKIITPEILKKAKKYKDYISPVYKMTSPYTKKDKKFRIFLSTNNEYNYAVGGWVDTEGIHVNLKSLYFYKRFINKSFKASLHMIISHELVHFIDPKFKNKSAFYKYGYILNPLEIDAFHYNIFSEIKEKIEMNKNLRDQLKKYLRLDDKKFMQFLSKILDDKDLPAMGESDIRKIGMYSNMLTFWQEHPKVMKMLRKRLFNLVKSQ